LIVVESVENVALVFCFDEVNFADSEEKFVKLIVDDDDDDDDDDVVVVVVVVVVVDVDVDDDDNGTIPTDTFSWSVSLSSLSFLIISIYEKTIFLSVSKKEVLIRLYLISKLSRRMVANGRSNVMNRCTFKGSLTACNCRSKRIQYSAGWA
jgi:hypothetical protein